MLLLLDEIHFRPFQIPLLLSVLPHVVLQWEVVFVSALVLWESSILVHQTLSNNIGQTKAMTTVLKNWKQCKHSISYNDAFSCYSSQLDLDTSLKAYFISYVSTWCSGLLRVIHVVRWLIKAKPDDVMHDAPLKTMKLIHGEKGKNPLSIRPMVEQSDSSRPTSQLKRWSLGVRWMCSASFTLNSPYLLVSCHRIGWCSFHECSATAPWKRPEHQVER